MGIRSILTILVVVSGLGFSPAQSPPRRPPKPGISTAAAKQPDDTASDGDGEFDNLDQDDRLSLIAAALDARVRRTAGRDCSHLVHAIYERAGLSYAYAPSSDLYAGVEGFQRVKMPEPGDLVVWRGHVGIVIQPSQHIFFSFMSSGPGIDDYQAPYWKSRGRPRFYRYIKNDSCAGCDSGKSTRRLLKIKR